MRHALIECTDKGFILQGSDRREFTSLVLLAAGNNDILKIPCPNPTYDVGGFIDDLFDADAGVL